MEARDVLFWETRLSPGLQAGLKWANHAPFLNPTIGCYPANSLRHLVAIVSRRRTRNREAWLRTRVVTADLNSTALREAIHRFAHPDDPWLDATTSHLQCMYVDSCGLNISKQHGFCRSISTGGQKLRFELAISSPMSFWTAKYDCWGTSARKTPVITLGCVDQRRQDRFH